MASVPIRPACGSHVPVITPLLTPGAASLEPLAPVITMPLFLPSIQTFLPDERTTAPAPRQLGSL